MVRVFKCCRNWRNKNCNQQNENKIRHQNKVERRRINFFFIFCILTKAKKTGFKSKHKQRSQKTGIRIKFTHHTVFRFCKSIGIQRHKQVIQKSSEDTAESVDGGLRCKFFERVQIFGLQILIQKSQII